MIDLIFDKATINLDKLDEEVRAGLGSVTSGVSARNGQAIVHVREDVTDAQRQQAEQIVASHDSNQKTARQQAAEARQTKLVQLRASNSVDLDVSNFLGDSPSVQALAQKLAWLEQELRELRGGA